MRLALHTLSELQFSHVCQLNLIHAAPCFMRKNVDILAISKFVCMSLDWISLVGLTSQGDYWSALCTYYMHTWKLVHTHIAWYHLDYLYSHSKIKTLLLHKFCLLLKLINLLISIKFSSSVFWFIIGIYIKAVTQIQFFTVSESVCVEMVLHDKVAWPSQQFSILISCCFAI